MEGSSPPCGWLHGPRRRAKVAGFRISTRQSLLSLPTSSEAVCPSGTAGRVQPQLSGGKGHPHFGLREGQLLEQKHGLPSRGPGPDSTPSGANVEAGSLEKPDSLLMENGSFPLGWYKPLGFMSA